MEQPSPTSTPEERRIFAETFRDMAIRALAIANFINSTGNLPRRQIQTDLAFLAEKTLYLNAQVGP